MLLSLRLAAPSKVQQRWARLEALQPLARRLPPPLRLSTCGGESLFEQHAGSLRVQHASCRLRVPSEGGLGQETPPWPGCLRRAKGICSMERTILSLELKRMRARLSRLG